MPLFSVFQFYDKKFFPCLHARHSVYDIKTLQYCHSAVPEGTREITRLKNLTNLCGDAHGICPCARPGKNPGHTCAAGRCQKAPYSSPAIFPRSLACFAVSSTRKLIPSKPAMLPPSLGSPTSSLINSLYCIQ